MTEIQAEGSNISGITFAKNGKLEVAHLPDSVATLTMENLQCITDFQMSYDNLVNLTIENSNIDEKAIVEESVDTLRELRLVGIDWTEGNSLAETDFLNEILSLYESELVGRVYVSGSITQKEIDDYRAAWKDLTVLYEESNIVPQLVVTYVNADGTVLKRIYVNQGDFAPDPVATGLIDTPTLEEKDPCFAVANHRFSRCL